MSNNLEQNEADILDGLIKDPKIRRILATAMLVSLKAAKSSGRTAIARMVASFSAYEPYLLKTYGRVATIKTFADPTKAVSLLDHYVKTNLRREGHRFDQDDIRLKILKNENMVISALAGFGKSVLMRFLALSLYENPAGKIPIFVELRDLNRTKNPDVLSYIHATYRQKSDLNKEVFKRALKQGFFVLFFDGYDELNYEHRDSIQSQILEISETYPDTSVVVSSRPDQKFNSWESFETLSICPMTLPQVTELIEKIDYDADLKNKFIKKLNSGLYEKHESFLSTPLLTTLMMLTFEQNANIPEKMHLFYLRAFETLFDKHDTYKEQYERKRRSGLRIDQFSRLFSVFCFNTYIVEEFEFSKTKLISYLSDSISYCGFSLDINDLLFDLVESVCLLQLEGHEYSFVHRSFQEYFTAVFLEQCPEDFRNEFLDEFHLRPWDTVLPMLFDMCQNRLEVGWVLPRTKAYVEEIQGSKRALSRAAFASVWKELILIENKKGEAAFRRFVPGKYRSLVSVLHSFYPDDIGPEFRFLTGRGVDEFCGLVAEKLGVKYCDVLSYNGDLEHKVLARLDFEKDDDFPIKTEMVRVALEGFKSIEKIRDSVSDHKVVQQKFLSKIRSKNSQGSPN